MQRRGIVHASNVINAGCKLRDDAILRVQWRDRLRQLSPLARRRRTTCRQRDDRTLRRRRHVEELRRLDPGTRRTDRMPRRLRERKRRLGLRFIALLLLQRLPEHHADQLLARSDERSRSVCCDRLLRLRRAKRLRNSMLTPVDPSQAGSGVSRASTCTRPNRGSAAQGGFRGNRFFRSTTRS
jgi:hypothetical protein